MNSCPNSLLSLLKEGAIFNYLHSNEYLKYLFKYLLFIHNVTCIFTVNRSAKKIIKNKKYN